MQQDAFNRRLFGRTRSSSLPLLLSVLLMSAADGHCKVIPLSSSIVLVGAQDYVLQGHTSRCTEMVDRAAGQTNSRLNFAPVLFWVDRTVKTPTPSQTSKISYFCFQRYVQSDGALTCQPATQTDIDAFQAGMQACFARAVQHRMAIHISPQLNDGTGQAAWQNLLNLNPLTRYEDFSYIEVMLYPLARAVNGAVQEGTQVYFTLQGQMGSSLFYHPLEYLQAAGTVHHIMHEGVPAEWPEFIKFGISLNYNKVCGCILTDVADPAGYIQLLPAAFRSLAHKFDFEILRELFDRTDFISISGAAPLSADFSIERLQGTFELFARELLVFGIDVYQRWLDLTLQLHWTDIGIDDFFSVAGQVGLVAGAQHPSGGVVDNPQEAEHLLSLRDVNTTDFNISSAVLAYYEQATQFLWHQHVLKYQVDAAFLSNQGASDIQGIYSDSLSQAGTYYNSGAAGMIRHHNQRSQHLVALAAMLGEPGILFLIESRDLHKT
ncbi:TPA: hypothetical protein ACH3X2_012806 [Trebouxia sp. C0005]